jgi:hypothetical protein
MRSVSLTFLKQIISDRSKLMMAYVIVSQLIFFFADYYKFFPNASFFLIDYRHSVDFPQFWDTNPPFYSILPFDTVICLIFKYLNLNHLNFLIIFLIVPYFHAVFSFTRIFVDAWSLILSLLFLTLLSLPNLIGIYLGHFAILGEIAVFYCAIGIVQKRNTLSFLASLFIVCLKFNFMPLLLAPHLYQSKNIFRLDVIKTIALQFGLFMLLQVVCFYIVSYFYPDYTLQKILNSFGAYSADYVQGIGGFEFRCWLGSLSKIVVYMFGFSYYGGHIFVAGSYIFFGLAAAAIYWRGGRLIITFVFVLLCLYLNLATTFYWYSLLLPFFIYFFSRREGFGAEALLLATLLFPKPVLIESYILYDNFFTFLSISIYLMWKIVAGSQSETSCSTPLVKLRRLTR